MKFLIDTEKFLSKKISFKHFMLMSVLSISLLWIVVSGMLYEDYFPIITAIVTLVLCFSFHKEIQKLHSQNQIISFQKNIAINGFDSCIFAFFVFNESGKCVFVNRVAQNLFPGFKIRSIENFIICFGKYPKVVGAIHELQKIAKNSKQHHIDVPMNLHSNNTTLWPTNIGAESGYQHENFNIDAFPKLEGFKLELLQIQGIPGVPGNTELLFSPRLLNSTILRGLRSTQYNIP